MIPVYDIAYATCRVEYCNAVFDLLLRVFNIAYYFNLMILHWLPKLCFDFFWVRKVATVTSFVFWEVIIDTFRSWNVWSVWATFLFDFLDTCFLLVFWQPNTSSPPVSRCHSVPRNVRQKWGLGCIAVVPTWIRNRMSGLAVCVVFRVECSEFCFDQSAIYAVAACFLRTAAVLTIRHHPMMRTYFLCKSKPAIAHTFTWSSELIHFTFLTNIRFLERHSLAVCSLEQTCSGCTLWITNRTCCSWDLECSAHSVVRFTFFFFLFLFVGRRPCGFSFCTAFTHVIISLSQTHRYLVSYLFCFVRAVLFFLYVYRNSVWSSTRLAVLHIVAIVNRTEPDLDVVVANVIQINYSRFYSRRL